MCGRAWCCPSEDAAGKISPSQAQIVGGGNAAVGELPWQVVVYPGPYLCGGTLDRRKLGVDGGALPRGRQRRQPISPGTVQVIAGEYRLASNDNTEQERGVAQVYVHPDYNANTSDNDIGLLHLSAPVTLGPSVTAIARVESPANDGLVTPGVEALVSGWGALTEGGAVADILQKVRVPIVSNATCNSAYGNTITE